jgi:alpha-beta hydrolase superfamily lysophospholipase
MTPFRFGPPQRQLLGLYHPAAPGRTRPTAVLLCNPHGQEAIRTHRMFRVLAERLSRAGIHVLRFDYLGTGDSDGDDTDGHLDLWRDNILLAHQELKRRAANAAVTWIGVRLGATLACLATATAPASPPERLVLWEPLTDGPAYLAEMARNHQRALASSYSLIPPKYKQPGPDEALGFGLGDTLLSQLRTLKPDTLPAVRTRHVTLVSGHGQAGAPALARRLAQDGVAHRTIPFEHAFDWASEEALNTALVPHEALQVLARAVEEAPEDTPA